MAPQLIDLAQESPSIGEEMTAAHPSLQPKISSSNLRGPLNFITKKQDQQAFSGLNAAEVQETAPSAKI